MFHVGDKEKTTANWAMVQHPTRTLQRSQIALEQDEPQSVFLQEISMPVRFLMMDRFPAGVEVFGAN
jgi:hypothetical protein